MQRFLDLFISINCSTCFRQAAVLVWQYLTLYVEFRTPDDGRRNRLKHVEQFIEINRSRKRCILLVVLYRYTRNARIYERQIKYVFVFSLRLLAETFLVLRTIQRDTVINAQRSSRKVPVPIVRFEWNLNFLDRFSKNNFMNIRPVGVEF